MSERVKANLYELDIVGLAGLMAELGQPAFRARQVWEWLYVHLAADFLKFCIGR